MKKKLPYLLIVALILNSCSSSSSLQDQLVLGKIHNNSEYKGGANPPQEILDALAIYHPSANQNFYIRSATNYAPFTPILANFTTDLNGNYSITLPIGAYSVIGQEKYNFEQNPLADITCNYLQAPDFIITVVANQQVYTSEFTDKANYCLGHPQ
jgi:hypothetical protein